MGLGTNPFPATAGAQRPPAVDGAPPKLAGRGWTPASAGEGGRGAGGTEMSGGAGAPSLNAARPNTLPSSPAKAGAQAPRSRYFRAARAICGRWYPAFAGADVTD